MVKCNALWKLAKDVSSNHPPYDMLASSSKRLLYKALVIAGSASFEGGTKDSYWEVVGAIKIKLHCGKSASVCALIVC